MSPSLGGHAAGRMVARPLPPPREGVTALLPAGAVLVAIAAGGLVALQPVLLLGALAAVGCVALAFLAPVTHLILLLVLTAVVGFQLQNRVGGPLLASDALLLTGLLRGAVVLLSQRVDVRRLVVAGVMLAFMAVTAVQMVRGIRHGANPRQAGAEARELLDFGTVLIAMPIVADPRGRLRLARGLMILGLLLGVWGLAQWALGIQVASNVDLGIRDTQPFATSGAGQLHAGLYGYPVAVIMAVTALMSGQGRSGVQRWLLYAIVATNAMCLVLTYERTFWLTVLVTLGFVVAKLERGRRVRATVTMLVTSIAALGVLATTSPGDLIAIRDRVLSLAQPSNDNSVRYRVVETRHVIEKVKAKPVAGWGLGDTIFWGRPWDQVPPTSAWFAHNGYLWVIWKVGAVAAALLFLLIGWAILLRAPPERDPTLRSLRTGAQGGLMVLLLSSVTFPAFNSINITAVMGLLLALCFAPRAHPHRIRPRPSAPTRT